MQHENLCSPVWAEIQKKNSRKSKVCSHTARQANKRNETEPCRRGVKWLSPDVSLELWGAIKDFGSNEIQRSKSIYPVMGKAFWGGALGNAHASVES